MTGHEARDDDREALSKLLLSLYDHGTSPNALREAEAVLSFLVGRGWVSPAGAPAEGGNPIADPDPTGEYPRGWHPAEEWEYRAVGALGEPVSGTHGSYESAFGEAEENEASVAGFERRSTWQTYDPQARQ